jgi:thiol-disulfide isomerase/thioredoxin
VVARRPSPFLIATLGGLAAAVIAVAATLGSASDDDPAVTLDQPGEYQEPTIATNTDVSGRELPEVDLLDLDGNAISSSRLLDGRPLVVNLWFSTCQPCKREMPAIQEAHLEYGDRVRFVGVNSQDSPEITASFADEIGVTYDIVRDPNGNLTTAAGVATFPMTFFVSSDGVIVEQIAGEMTRADIDSGVEKALGE